MILKTVLIVIMLFLAITMLCCLAGVKGAEKIVMKIGSVLSNERLLLVLFFLVIIIFGVVELLKIWR